MNGLVLRLHKHLAAATNCAYATVSLATGVLMYDSLINRKILSNVSNDVPLSGGKNSLHKTSGVIKPLEEWQPEEHPFIGCIYCMNNGGYHGPAPLTAEDYETHIVKKHPGKPAYPGPADIEKYGLELPEPV